MLFALRAGGYGVAKVWRCCCDNVCARRTLSNTIDMESGIQNSMCKKRYVASNSNRRI
jgi:hypothetical protein